MKVREVSFVLMLDYWSTYKMLRENQIIKGVETKNINGFWKLLFESCSKNPDESKVLNYFLRWRRDLISHSRCFAIEEGTKIYFLAKPEPITVNFTISSTLISFCYLVVDFYWGAFVSNIKAFMKMSHLGKCKLNKLILAI